MEIGKEGFKNYIWVVIVIDGKILNERIEGVLLVAVTKDVNNQVLIHVFYNIINFELFKICALNN